MARTKQMRAATVPGAGMLFALRAIGLAMLVRWLASMSQMSLFGALSGIASSPWACINLIFLFLLIGLPGAKARAERPFHPLPQWLRQALRLFAVLGFLFALWIVGAFVWTAGWRRAVHTIAATNGWLVVAPALYAVVIWLCRPRALWRTNIGARRFSIGRYATALDVATRTLVVWAESRKVGQYDARELSVRWPEDAAGAPPVAPATAPALPPAEGNAGTFVPPAAANVADSAARRGPRGWWAATPRVELLWDSPAAAGHNRQTIFRVPLATAGDRLAARALDAALRQV